MIRSSFVIAIFCWLSLCTLNAQPARMNGFNLDHASIPLEAIKSGGPPRDGIPAIDQPMFKPIGAYTFFPDDIRVLGLTHRGVSKAYPIPILNWHEVVNDHFGESPVIITYCPLCGSGLAFNADIDGNVRQFGVSGLLYNSDVLLYDRQTESLWSQLKMQAISGPDVGQHLEMLPLVHTTLGQWKREYPESLVLTTRTGYVRNYEQSPYSDYEENDKLYFPTDQANNAYPPKEWVLGITVNGKSRAYPFSELMKHPDSLLTDTFQNQVFQIRYDILNDTAIIQDAGGSPYPSVSAYWFAWFAFHPETEVFETNNH